MQASVPNSAPGPSHAVSPISCPPQEKPVVSLADVLRGGAENDRRSLQAYLHTLAAREKEKRKRKRMERRTKRSTSTSSKRKKRGEEDPTNPSNNSGSQGPNASASLASENAGSNDCTPSGSMDMSAMMMARGSVDLSAMRMTSTEYDAMRGSLDLGLHHARSRSVDFGALSANAAAFDAMRASLDMSVVGPGLGAHYSHHGSLAGYQSHHGSFAHHRASVDFDAMAGFGADISPTSSFCLEGPVALEPAPLASFSVDELQPQALQHQHQHQHQQQHPPHYFQQPVHQQQSSMAAMPQAQPQPQPQQQQEVFTDLPDFEDFVSSAFLQSFPLEDESGYNSALLLQPGVPEQQPSPEVVFAVPAPPQHVLQRSQSPAPASQAFNPSHNTHNLNHNHNHNGRQQPQQQQHSQLSCSCPDCHVSSVSASSLSVQHGGSSHHEGGSQLVQSSLGQTFAVEEDQVENFLTQFIEWSELRGAASPVPSPVASLYY